MNCRAKFDADSFILGGEIHNHTNTQTYTHKKHTQTNSKPHLACRHVWIKDNTVLVFKIHNQ